ncbi:hypothetical protein Micbo1qcDRAFT_156475 [Microdochium bolleyi]|uniref:Uncharacterized protein n=1 Tax=Microdochium bolleyi TaxID=196109 RepID=A0A136JK74_9PEZI|nr:hypothetical protein Micbo1qcDRAFT_156475 [Microdochium bolleyi]
MIQQPLCRSVARSTANPATLSRDQKRHAHWRPRWPKIRQTPARERFPIFDAPPLLIDLDAEDCRAVRPHDPVIDGTPHSSVKPRAFELKAINKRINEFNKRSKSWERNFATVRENVFHPWRVSDLDVLAALLLGSDAGTPLLKKQPSKADKSGLQLFTTLTQNGIQPSGVRENLPSITRYMLRRQKLALRKAPASEDTDSFRRAVDTASKPCELERIVTSTMQTSDGRALVAACSEAVADKCLTFVKMPGNTPTEKAFREKNGHVLCFVNNLIINFRHHRMADSIHFDSLAATLAWRSGVQLEPADPVEGAHSTGEKTRTGAQERSSSPMWAAHGSAIGKPPGLKLKPAEQRGRLLGLMPQARTRPSEVSHASAGL